MAKNPRTAKTTAEKDDPKEVFASGESFRRGSQVLVRPQQQQLLPPAIVCASISFELYLKSLIIERKVDPPEHHNTQVLFGMLTQSQQNEVRLHFEARAALRDPMHVEISRRAGRSSPPLTFEKCLGQSKDAFIKIRYFYRDKHSQTWLANDIWEGTRNLILRLHPDWKVF